MSHTITINYLISGFVIVDVEYRRNAGIRQCARQGICLWESVFALGTIHTFMADACLPICERAYDRAAKGVDGLFDKIDTRRLKLLYVSGITRMKIQRVKTVHISFPFPPVNERSRLRRKFHAESCNVTSKSRQSRVSGRSSKYFRTFTERSEPLSCNG